MKDPAYATGHVYFAPNDHGTLNCSLAFDIFDQENRGRPFYYVHTESVTLRHWRAKFLPNVAVTWHWIWYEIMHSKLFQELLHNPNGQGPMNELQEAMPRLSDEIKFFSSYSHQICISNSAGEVLVNVYQLPQRNVHVIVNGVDETDFEYDPISRSNFREKIGIPSNVTLVLGVAGRELVESPDTPICGEISLRTKPRHASSYEKFCYAVRDQAFSSSVKEVPISVRDEEKSLHVFVMKYFP
ncbi:uncharacterized protein LOC132032057 [Lycium ferocissimum]|uniref:uncharacterized protein LOC132032057 n=1 Tax=Lycium ferocissimum TaxID=112874 RepID=UPI00281603D9|nr:uncharacterized protein LOC132032057 [Lycium ferocissimum]